MYNLLGQEIASLVNSLQEAGTYSVPFDAVGLNSGMYFYRLSTKDGFTAVRKMMLVQ